MSEDNISNEEQEHENSVIENRDCKICSSVYGASIRHTLEDVSKSNLRYEKRSRIARKELDEFDQKND